MSNLTIFVNRGFLIVAIAHRWRSTVYFLCYLLSHWISIQSLSHIIRNQHSGVSFWGCWQVLGAKHVHLCGQSHLSFPHIFIYWYWWLLYFLVYLGFLKVNFLTIILLYIIDDKIKILVFEGSQLDVVLKTLMWNKILLILLFLQFINIDGDSRVCFNVLWQKWGLIECTHNVTVFEFV
jgi:hypothetical protein